MSWPPAARALHVTAPFKLQNDHPGSLLVEHFNDPYETVLTADTDQAVRAAAYAYLAALLAVGDLQNQLQIPAAWVDALAAAAVSDPPDRLFGWVPSAAPAGHGIPRISPPGVFRFQSPSDRLVALFASERLSQSHYTGSGFGLSFVAHLRQEPNRLVASFAGLSGMLPVGVYRAHPLTRERLQTHGTWLGPLLSAEKLYRDPEVLETMAAAANLEKFVVRRVRIAASDNQWWIERQGVGTRPESGVHMPYLVSMLSTGDALSHQHRIHHVTALVADATSPPVPTLPPLPPGPHPNGQARVFDNDPSSVRGSLVRPTADGLDAERVTTQVFAAGANHGALQYPPTGNNPVLMVMPSPRYVAADRNLPAASPRPLRINIPGPAADNLPIRSDDASALQAFFHARDLLQRMQAYGWTPQNYFRATRPEIQIFYRSGISPGPGKDGRCVNARVLPEGWPAHAVGQQPNNAILPAVQIHLAWADLRRRARGAWTPGGAPSPAIPFGVAADKRWMWHEFGHVLLVTSTGELEFRFAHSPGDAMAAIAADPESNLTGTLRTLTFPFVFVPRQHNRCASDGWSWSGTMHAALRDVPADQHPRRKGYASEQILSSSLFRLYRCIGGDTGAAGPPGDQAAHERHRASHYCLYLIMQAMQLMGDAGTQAVATPDQFVRLLREADRQVDEWVAQLPGRPPYRRMGGTATKVIRWAFEAQGLYGTGNGPGQPEGIDIYIRDRRPATDADIYGHTDYGAGSYVPVSLDWPGAGNAAPWHAHTTQGMVHRPDDGRVDVLVRNRGSDAPKPEEAPVQVTATVRLWYAAWANGTPPSWDPTGNGWTECAASGQATQAVPWNAPQTFTFIFAPAPGRYILFAQATCAEDHAITDAAMGLACSLRPTPLADLVPNDNNLGVLVVTI